VNFCRGLGNIHLYSNYTFNLFELEDKVFLLPMERLLTITFHSYTQAIDSSAPTESEFLRDVYRKRAFANLTAKFYVAAKDDALASCSGETFDSKAYYCAGRSAYELGAYAESKNHFEKALSLSPNDLKCKKDLVRTRARIGEEENGDYDFKSMVKSVTMNQLHLDHADYTKNAIIGPTAHAGRGLFAPHLLKAGSLVLCEKAFCLPDRYCQSEQSNDLVMFNFNTNARTQRPAQPQLFRELVQKLYHNAHLTSSFFELDGGNYIRSGKEGQLVDGVPIVDSWVSSPKDKDKEIVLMIT